MSGLDEILNMIDLRQKETEAGILIAAEDRIRAIRAEADRQAESAYEEYIKNSSAKNKAEFENACASADASMKRKVLSFKVEQIDLAVENTLKKLHSLEDGEYFALIESLIMKHIGKGEGVVSLSKRDLERLPADFESRIKSAAAEKGAELSVSREAAAIEDGFILSYGDIFENCSFRAVVEAEREGVRDTAAKALFG